MTIVLSTINHDALGWTKKPVLSSSCRGVRAACEAMKAAAGKLSSTAAPQANAKAKHDTEVALQHLADAVEALQ